MSSPAFKVVTIGDSGVGKTSIINRAVYGTFTEDIGTTIGATFEPFHVDIQGEDISLNLWDTAGQEKYQSLIPLYLRGANAGIIVIDMSEEQSIQRCDDYYEILKNSIPDEGFIYLVGNKSDIASPSFSLEEFEKKAQQLNVAYFIVSACNGTGIQSLFERIAKDVSQVSVSVPVKEPTISTTTNKDNTNCC